jgi:DNA repair exonuclease SbcCD ATPase subunit
MKILSVKLTNWRNIAETELHLKRLTVIRGANHRGKSGIAQAIEFALTGRCDATSKSGAGAGGLIRLGSEKALIEMRLHANKEIALRCSLTASSGRSLTFKDPRDANWDGANVSHWMSNQRDALSCLLNTRYFIDLDANDQKHLLSSIILPDSFEFPEDIRQKAAHLGWKGQDPAWTGQIFEVIEAVYEFVFNRRRDLNRDFKNLHIPQAMEMPPNAAASTEEALAQLASLRTSVYEREKAWRAALKERGTMQAQIAGLDQRVQALEAKARTEEETLSSNEKMVLSAGQLKDRKKTASNDEEYARLQGEIDGFTDTIAGIEAVLRTFDRLTDASACPTCGQAVTEDFLLKAMTPYKEKLDKAHRGFIGTTDAIKALGDIAGAKADLEKHEQAKTSVARSRSIISETHGLLKTAETELAELRTKLPPEPAEDPEIPAIRKQTGELEESLKSVAVFEARTKEIEAATVRQEKLRLDIALAGELVAWFGPQGIKAKLIAENIGSFTESMNAALRAWGYSCGFEIEPYGFRVALSDGKTTLPLSFLSGSEQLQFGIAFQVALAQVSGIGLVIIDEADLFDSAGRGALFPMLLESELESVLDQVIVIGTNESREVPNLEDCVYYIMNDDGNAEKLTPKAAITEVSQS